MLQKLLLQASAARVLLFPNRASSLALNRFFQSTTINSDDFQSIKYWIEGRVAHIQLNRPESLNAIDTKMPSELQAAVQKANWDPAVRVILLYGANNTFCSGYDLKLFAQMAARGQSTFGSQEMPWDPATDFRIMSSCTSAFMEIWRSMKPVVAKIQGAAIGGGSDMALACDVTFIEDTAKFGYPPSRVWGCPTTAFWFYRLGLEKAKRILFTGQILSGTECAAIGLIGQASPKDQIDADVNAFIQKMVTVPANQLWFQKQMINHAVEEMGLLSTQRLATIFDGMSRHTPEGVAFKERAVNVGFKTAVRERDSCEETVWSDLVKK